ncbi:AraC family transcriptional regulator [Parafrankia sp. EUN1f]|uniref:AraC family transcriptional regulator n=1 Tax=Parafrankia sp. EUN1f TaxID=102897 RepID=UPI0001C4426F|nr:AraC family transcriptional regulator [Parafrankia sp. EUN1f]EFC85342.1 transcriptional regulator, AraC family [Parafrankia sp. EUN1f]
MKPTARYASLNRYLELCQSLGIGADAARLMHDVGLDPSGLAMQDTRIPAASIVGLLENSAAASGCEVFGMRLAELRQFSSLGPLSLVLREEPDVRSAVDMLIRYEHTYNEALRLHLSERSDIAVISVGFDLGEDIPCQQSYDLAVGALHGILREFLGPGWRPASACFAHPAPADCEVYERFLGLIPRFEQPFSGVVLHRRDLDAPNRMSDPHLRAYAHQLLKPLGAPRDATIVEKVRAMIELFLPAGRCSATQIAQGLLMDRRTMHRHLDVFGVSFSTLVDQVRAKLAEEHLRNGRYSLTEISRLLGFAAPSGFSRWFRNEYGCSPSAWKATQGRLDPPAP